MRAPVNRERLRAAVFVLLLAGLIAVLATRAVRLARQPEELTGIDERKWLHSSGPVSLYEKRSGRWIRIGNVSNFKPGPGT